MIAPPEVARLNTSPKVIIFLQPVPPKVIIFFQPVPYYFISNQCLKSDRWNTLFLRKLIVAMDL